MKSTDRELRWRQIVKRQAGSGLSIRKFCENEGISHPSFYAWRQKFRERASNRVRARKSGRRGDGPDDQAAFIPLNLLELAGVLEVVHPLGCQVRISGVVDAVALKQVLEVLDERGHG
jgi:hypothetical protein